MNEKVKICCIADLHIGVKSYSQIDVETRFYLRELEVINNFRQIIQMCIDQSISILIIAGDVYHNSKPSPNLQDEVNKLLNYASVNKLYVLLLDGNHDLSKQIDSVSVLKTTNTFQIPYIIQTSKFLDKEISIRKDTVRFIFLPTYTTNEQVKYLLDQNLYENNDYKHPIIVIGHFTVQGAQLNDWLVAENEEYIDLNNFNNRNISFVVLGHLHRSQILKNNNPFIFYTGSLQRIDFNEENQEKGYWIINTKTKETNFYPIETQRFYTLQVDINDDKSVLEQIKEKINVERINNAVVRIIINISEKMKLTTDEEKQLISYINDYNPQQLLAIKQNIIDKKHIRNSSLTELLTIDKALEIFYKDQVREQERIKLGKKIIEQYNLIKN